MTTCLQKLLELHELCTFQATEGDKVGPASKSEIRRWFKSGVVEVNFDPAIADEPWPPFIKSLVLFPKNQKRRCTLFYDSVTVLVQLQE